MGSRKPKAKKLRLAKYGKQTRWAPLWVIPKICKGIKKIHPMRFTAKKRNWRRNKTRA